MRTCPFYGFHQGPGLLIDSEGNQCALNPGYAPCQMELMRQGHVWAGCLYNTSPEILNKFEQFQVFPKERTPKECMNWEGISFQEWLKIVKANRV